VIVRIATEGQFEIPEDAGEELNRLDNETVSAVEAGDEARINDTFAKMIALVRERGSLLSSDDLRGSMVILPPPDLTLAEAEHEFTGDGILPD
jgi:hypothetical protein